MIVNSARFFSLILGAGLALQAIAQVGEQSRSIPGDQALEDLSRLGARLPTIVCDAQTIARPPALFGGPVHTQGSLSFALTPPGVGGFFVPIRDEGRKNPTWLIRHLLEDPETHWATPALATAWEIAIQNKSLLTFKAQASSKICSVLVQSGRFLDYFSQHSGEFFRLETNRSAGQSFVVELEDVENRFGKIKNQWHVAGWIEPHEIFAYWMDKIAIRRISHPVTHETRSIVIENVHRVPLGWLYAQPGESQRWSWSTWIQQRESAAVRSKLFEIYRQQIEWEAYHALASAPHQSTAIQKLQEFYKNLIKAYEIYPEAEQFQGYKKMAQAFEVRDAWIRQVLDAQVVRPMLESPRANQGVGLTLFKPDPFLHAMMQEYRARLKSLPSVKK